MARAARTDEFVHAALPIEKASMSRRVIVHVADAKGPLITEDACISLRLSENQRCWRNSNDASDEAVKLVASWLSSVRRFRRQRQVRADVWTV